MSCFIQRLNFLHKLNSTHVPVHVAVCNLQNNFNSIDWKPTLATQKSGLLKEITQTESLNLALVKAVT